MNERRASTYFRGVLSADNDSRRCSWLCWAHEHVKMLRLLGREQLPAATVAFFRRRENQGDDGVDPPVTGVDVLAGSSFWPSTGAWIRNCGMRRWKLEKSEADA